MSQSLPHSYQPGKDSLYWSKEKGGQRSHPKPVSDGKEGGDSQASSFVLSDDVVAPRQHLVHRCHHAYLALQRFTVTRNMMHWM